MNLHDDSEPGPPDRHSADTAEGQKRDETPPERLDRNLIELLNELRVSGTGIQVLLAFLLVIPFDSRFGRLGRFEKDLYLVALVCMAGSAVCLIAPSVHHRLLFRHGERPFLIDFANRIAIVGMALLAVGLLAILVLLSMVVFGAGVAIVVGICAFLALGGIWFVVPLNRRRSE